MRAATEPRAAAGRWSWNHPGGPMFAFFSSRLGCLGSILVSVAGTLVLLFVLGFL